MMPWPVWIVTLTLTAMFVALRQWLDWTPGAVLMMVVLAPLVLVLVVLGVTLALTNTQGRTELLEVLRTTLRTDLDALARLLGWRR